MSLIGSPFAGCTDQLTVAAWVKVNTLATGSRVFDFGSQAETYVYLAPSDGTAVHLGMGSAAGTFNLVTDTPWPDDQAWHHVAVTVNSANLVVLYVDGAPAAQAVSSGVHPSDLAGTTENWLGRSRASDPALDGAIDELRISCRAYTADEIKMLGKH